MIHPRLLAICATTFTVATIAYYAPGSWLALTVIVVGCLGCSALGARGTCDE